MKRGIRSLWLFFLSPLFAPLEFFGGELPGGRLLHRFGFGRDRSRCGGCFGILAGFLDDIHDGVHFGHLGVIDALFGGSRALLACGFRGSFGFQGFPAIRFFRFGFEAPVLQSQGRQALLIALDSLQSEPTRWLEGWRRNRMCIR